jgi:hypothetical protein
MAASRMSSMSLMEMLINSRKFGDDGVGGLVANDLGVTTRGHVVVPGAVFADSEDVVL